MPESLTADSFSPHVGSRFDLRIDNRPPAAGQPGAAAETDLALELAEVLRLGRAPDPSAPSPQAQIRQPFSLLFRGPLRPLLPQRIYRLEHAKLGVLDLFLVPLGPDPAGQRYEAVFT